MSHSICTVVTGLIMLYVPLSLWGQEHSDELDNSSHCKVATQVEKVVKVFSIAHADASELKDVIDILFPQTTDENSDSMWQIRLGVDARTNSILASGPVGDLQVIEALLTRLDTAKSSQGTTPQKTSVYRLQNAPAEDVAHAIQQWLTERAKLEGQGNKKDAFAKEGTAEQISCIVVPEVVSNSLIVSTSFNEKRARELDKVIRALDNRPDLVKIKVFVKKKVDGVDTVISTPQILTLDQKTTSITFGSELESYTIVVTPYIIRSDSQVEVTNIPAQTKDR